MTFLEQALRLSDDLADARIRKESAVWARSLGVPVHFVEFLLLIEDKRFPTHRGIDGFAVLRALRQNLRRRRWSEGASTITQQLYNLHLQSIGREPQRNLAFKRRQIAFAVRANSTHSKSEQLERYVAGVYWGRSYIGLLQAASGYFHKSPIELNAEESFFLAERLACPNRRAGSRIDRILSRRCVAAKLRHYGSDEVRLTSVYRALGLD